MRLAVLDTNVIVSAAIRPDGAPAALIMDWALEGQIQLVTSPSVVREYREVVRRPKFRPYGFPPQWLEFLIGESLHLPDAHVAAETGPDADDLVFLALARLAGAWLVTGNLKQIPEDARNGVTVMSAADYLLRLQALG